MWRRQDERTAVCYVCFEDLERAKFCVQSVDFFYWPPDPDRMAAAAQLVELLVESDPGDRSGWFASIEDAIEAHDIAFENPRP